MKNLIFSTYKTSTRFKITESELKIPELDPICKITKRILDLYTKVPENSKYLILIRMNTQTSIRIKSS